MDNKNCIASVPDCIKELSLLKSLIYTLELKLKNLGLEDLEDVTYCLNPKIGDSLVYNGNKWVAKKVSGSGGGSTVEVESLLSTGNPIAKITVDGEEHTILESNNGGGTGNLDNVKVNNITGTVNNKIAEVTVTGNDINVSTFEEPDKTNEELEIESSDKVTEALAKLLKALKDDEAAITEAFNSTMEATGFDEMLHYLKEPSGTILGDDDNVNSLLTADAKLQTKIKENIDKLNFHESNRLIFTTTGGTTLTTFSIADKNTNNLPYDHVILLPLLVIFNLTADYPLPANEYYAMGSGNHNVISLEMANYLYTDVLIRSGCILTFLINSTTWEAYLYIGPNEGNRISVNGWVAPENWYKLWTAILA